MNPAEDRLLEVALRDVLRSEPRSARGEDVARAVVAEATRIRRRRRVRLAVAGVAIAVGVFLVRWRLGATVDAVPAELRAAVAAQVRVLAPIAPEAGGLPDPAALRDASRALRVMLRDHPRARELVREPLLRRLREVPTGPPAMHILDVLVEDRGPRVGARVRRELSGATDSLSLDALFVLAGDGDVAATRALESVAAGRSTDGATIYAAAWFGLSGDRRGVPQMNEFVDDLPRARTQLLLYMVVATAMRRLGEERAWSRMASDVESSVANLPPEPAAVATRRFLARLEFLAAAVPTDLAFLDERVAAFERAQAERDGLPALRDRLRRALR